MATSAMVVTTLLALSACAATPAIQRAPATDRSAVELRALAANMKAISRVSAAMEPSPERRRIARVPDRPAFDPDQFVPDTNHVLRWPLSASSHPELAPQFAIAAALAEPGLDWIGLCRLGAQNRHAGPRLRDQVAYLRAWCAVGDHDIEAAIGGFAKLTRSVVGGMSPAVHEDIANILVHHGNADDATRLLSKYQIRDLEILDLLAATYLDIGRLEDAAEISELAIGRDDVNRANRCRRQARRVVMDPEPYRSPVNSGRLLFDEPAGSDRTCTRLEHELACWLRPALDCTDYFKEQGIDPRTTHLITVFHTWPAAPEGFPKWTKIADDAIAAGTIPGAYDFAVAALEQALREARCVEAAANLIGERARKLLLAADRPTAFDARLQRIVRDPVKLCVD